MGNQTNKRPLRFFMSLLIFLIPLGAILLTQWSYVGAANQKRSTSFSPFVEFALSNFSANENVGSMSITVDLSPASGNVVTVDYTITNGTATNPADYIPAAGNAGTLVFSPGETTKSIVIFVQNDTAVELNETVNLSLSNPVSATLGINNTSTFTILDDDVDIGATQTVIVASMTAVAAEATALATTPDSTVYVDAYEPNDDFANAKTVVVDTTACSLTTWPVGDVDYFRFVGKAGEAYKLSVTSMSEGLDTVLSVYDPQGNWLATNDDISNVDKRSEIPQILIGYTGYYYMRIHNQGISDPAGKTYCLKASRQTPPTAAPEPTRIPIDSCRNAQETDNDALATAKLLGTGSAESCDFVPPYGTGPDLDYFKIWVKPQVQYTCKATASTSWTDPAMVIFDQSANEVRRNDDIGLGDRNAEAQYIATYTGWLYILVYPQVTPEYVRSKEYRYSIQCTEILPSPTPTPSNTPTWVPFSTSVPGTGGGTGGGGTVFDTPTPFVFPTQFPTPTPYTPPPLATSTPRPNIVIQPLPTSSAATPVVQMQNIRVVVYYDLNRNNQPELTEGVSDLAAVVYDKNSGKLLAFGYTNDGGEILFNGIISSGGVRVAVPYLGYAQFVISSDETILLRIAPKPLPAAIP